MASRRIAVFVSLLAMVLMLGAHCARAQTDDLNEVSRLLGQGQFDKALDRVNAVLVSRPKDVRARFLKGLILTEQSKQSEAINVFSALTEEFPDLPEPFNNLAVLYAAQGQYEKSRIALEAAIRTHPSYATAYENLGDVYAKLASRAYDKALQLDRSNTVAEAKLNLVRELFPTSSRPPKVAETVAELRTKPTDSARVAKASPASAKSAAPLPADVSESKPSPQKEPAEPAPVVDGTGEVLDAVKSWASAWSKKDIDGYLAHYASDFKLPGRMSREAWEAQRKERIAKPRKIQVTIEALEVKFAGDNRATVTFRQHYRSDTLKVSNGKILVMVKVGGLWRIQEERGGG
jgi:tetratricopeptide (TPR) repeat protein